MVYDILTYNYDVYLIELEIIAFTYEQVNIFTFILICYLYIIS